MSEADSLANDNPLAAPGADAPPLNVGRLNCTPLAASGAPLGMGRPDTVDLLSNLLRRKGAAATAATAADIAGDHNQASVKRSGRDSGVMLDSTADNAPPAGRMMATLIPGNVSPPCPLCPLGFRMFRRSSDPGPRNAIDASALAAEAALHDVDPPSPSAVITLGHNRSLSKADCSPSKKACLGPPKMTRETSPPHALHFPEGPGGSPPALHELPREHQHQRGLAANGISCSSGPLSLMQMAGFPTSGHRHTSKYKGWVRGGLSLGPSTRALSSSVLIPTNKS